MTRSLTNPQAVTFDCWSTLLYEPDSSKGRQARVGILADTAKVEPARAAEALQLAWRHHAIQWHRAAAFTGRDMTAMALESLGASLEPRCCEELVSALEDVALDQDVRAVDGARPALEALARAGVRRALVCDTGFSPGRVVRALLDRLGLLELLETCAFSDEVGVPKPNAAIFRAALEPLGVAATSAVHVGDLRRSDVAGARGRHGHGANSGPPRRRRYRRERQCRSHRLRRRRLRTGVSTPGSGRRGDSLRGASSGTRTRPHVTQDSRMKPRSCLFAIACAGAVVAAILPACRKFYGDPAPSTPTETPPADAGIDVQPAPEPIDAASAPSSASPEASAAEPSADGVFRVNEPTRGTVPAAVVKQRVSEALPAITACYEHALARRPSLRGNLLIQFVVAADGSVAHAAPRPIDEPIEDDAVIECVVAQFRKLAFPKPHGDRAVVSYPLHFEPPPPDAGTPDAK